MLDECYDPMSYGHGTVVGVETCDVPELENATRSETGSNTYGKNAVSD